STPQRRSTGQRDELLKVRSFGSRLKARVFLEMTLGKCSLGRILPTKKQSFGLTKAKRVSWRRTLRKRSEILKRQSGAHTKTSFFSLRMASGRSWIWGLFTLVPPPPLP